MTERANTSTPKQIAIVGGGIAGLYCAWKLLTEGKGKYVITLFEALDRLGGRIETVPLNGINAECGPMRFELKIEDQFQDLCEEKLGIKFKEFTQAQGAPSSEEFPKYDLEEREWSDKQREAAAAAPHEHPATFSHLTSTLDLLKFGIYRIFHSEPVERGLTLPEVVDRPCPDQNSKIEEFADKQEDTYGNHEAYDNIRNKKFLYENGINSKVRQKLYEFGFWNALANVLSPGAIAKIRDTGTFYHLMPENPSASEWSIFWLRQSKSKKYNTLFMVAEPGGVYTIVERLCKKLEEFKKQGTYTPYQQTMVTAILSTSDHKIDLQTTQGEYKEFDHLILALPTGPLRTLMASLPIEIAAREEIKDIKRYIGAVIPFPLLKAFVVLRNPWWKKKPATHHGAYLVPTREIHYVWPPDGATDQVLIMFYTDRPATAYWQPHIDSLGHQKAQVHYPATLERDLARHVASLLPRESTDDEIAHLRRVEKSIINFAIRDWSKPPFEAACHAWRPHINVVQALIELRAFSLGGVRNNTHICGEAYSDYQGFIEGALRSANNVIDAIDPTIIV